MKQSEIEKLIINCRWYISSNISLKLIGIEDKHC